MLVHFDSEQKYDTWSTLTFRGLNGHNTQTIEPIQMRLGICIENIMLYNFCMKYFEVKAQTHIAGKLILHPIYGVGISVD